MSNTNNSLPIAVHSAIDALEDAGTASTTFNDLAKDSQQVAMHLAAAMGKLTRASNALLWSGDAILPKDKARLNVLGHAYGLTSAAMHFVRRYPEMTGTIGGEMIEDALDVLAAEYGDPRA